MEVVSEAGRFLNGFNNFDPIYKYSNERAVLGTWVDRALAMKMLTRRASLRPTTDEGTSALADITIEGLGDRFSNIIRHVTLRSDMTNGVEFVNASGQPVALNADYTYDPTMKVEEADYYNSSGLNRFLGLNDFGKTDISSVLLRQVNYGARTRGFFTHQNGIRKLRLFRTWSL